MEDKHQGRCPARLHCEAQSQISWDSVSLQVLSPFPTPAPPTLFRLFSTTAGSDPHHFWELSRLFSFSVAVTAAGDTGCVPGSPSHSTLALVWVRDLPFPIFFFFLFLQRRNNFSSAFWSFWKAHVTSACRGHVSLVLYQTELVCWRMKCPINLSSSTIWWGKSCINMFFTFSGNHIFSSGWETRQIHIQIFCFQLDSPVHPVVLVFYCPGEEA